MKMGSLLKKSLIALLPISLGLGVLLGVAKKPVQEVSGYSASSLPTTIDLNDTSEANIRSYYSSLNNKTQSERQGTNLLKNLKTILKNGQKYYSYENGTSIWQMYEITDRDWAKSPASSTTYGTYNSSTNKITNYTYGTSSSSSKNNPYIHALYINRDVNNQTTAWNNHNQDQWGINREHVWPKAEGFDSSGAGGARGDPMHLMAGNGYANNIHSNYYYGYVKTSSSYTDCGSKYSNQSGNLRGTSKTLNTGTVFEPQDSDKGDIARAIFYMVARYNYLSGSDSDGIDTNNPNLTLTQNISDWSSSGYTSSTSTQGKLGVLTDLLAWHHADPVDAYEIHRNNLLYTNFTNNRNPFIDFPEWADFIWGTATYNGTTYQSYSSTPTGYATPSSDTINGYNSGGGSDPVSVTGVSLNKSSTSISVGESEVLSATISPSNATNQGISWTSTNTSVAAVSSSGRVTGVAEGNATITVTTSDGSFTATCTVTVTASSGGGGSSDPKTDIMIAKGFGGYTTSSYSAAGTDYTGKANLTDSSGATYAMQVFNGSTGQVRGNQDTGSANFSCRNTTTYTDYYISEVSLTVDSGGTLDGSTTDRSVVWFGSSAYSNPTTAPSTGTKVTASPASSGQSTLTWTNTNTSYNYFILYNLKAASSPKCKDADTPLTVTWSPVSSSGASLDSITLDTSDVETEFYVGESFEYDGLSVTAHYSDGTDDIAIGYTVSNPDMTTPGQKTITITYSENSVERTATYNINVEYPGSSSSSQMVVSKIDSTYFKTGAIYLTGTETEGTSDCAAFTLTQTKYGGSYAVPYTYNDIRVYGNHRLTVTPKSGYKINSIVIVTNGSTSSTRIGQGQLINCTKGDIIDSTIVTLTPTTKTSAAGFSNQSLSNINYIVVNFEQMVLSWDSPTINVFSGSTLTASEVNSWNVSDSNATYSSSVLTIKLGGETISIPHTWQAEDDGKKLVAIYNGISTPESDSVIVTQTVNNIYIETASSSDTVSWTATAANNLGSQIASVNGTDTGTISTGDYNWSYTRTLVSLGSKKTDFIGFQGDTWIQLGSSGSLESLVISTSSIPGTITSVSVVAATAGTHKLTIDVGGTKYLNNADLITYSNTAGANNPSPSAQGATVTGTGSSSGSITISIASASTTTKAMLIRSISVSYEVAGTSQQIANKSEHTLAQRAAVKFAKAFNSAMDTTSYCTANLSTAWSACSSAYSTFLTDAAALGSAEETYAKNLIKYATAQYSDDSGEACIERMLKTYEICVQKHGQTAFMSDLVTVSAPNVSQLVSIVGENTNTIAIIVIITVISITSIGGYFFLRTRRKEDF